MGSIHAAGEWLRLSEHYRQMTDGELIAIARDRSQLTEIAQQILAQELSQRKLKVEPEKRRGEPGTRDQDAPRNPHPNVANNAPSRSGTRTHPVGDTGASAYGAPAPTRLATRGPPPTSAILMPKTASWLSF